MDQASCDAMVDLLHHSTTLKKLRMIKPSFSSDSLRDDLKSKLELVLCTGNGSLIAMFIGDYEDTSPPFDSLIPYLARNFAGRRLLRDEQVSVPLGLWPVVLGRIKDFTTYTVGKEKLAAACSDAMFHMVRNGNFVVAGGGSN